MLELRSKISFLVANEEAMCVDMCGVRKLANDFMIHPFQNRVLGEVAPHNGAALDAGAIQQGNDITSSER